MKNKGPKPLPLMCYDIWAQEANELRQQRKLPVGGFLKQSMIDFPGNVSAVVFTLGCNFRCNYCHNPSLVYPWKMKRKKGFDADHIIKWSIENRHLLDAVVITGGEPTIHNALPDFIRKLRTGGLKIKLDTNGTNPEMLKLLVNEDMIDYIAMDVKAPLNEIKYRSIVGNRMNAKLLGRIIESVNLLNSGKVMHEYRTTLDQKLTLDDLKSIVKTISGDYYLQQVRGMGNPQESPPRHFSPEELESADSSVKINIRD